MENQNSELNVLDVTRAVNLMKHTIGYYDKFEKQKHFTPWRNYFDGQDDTLDKLVDMGLMNRHAGWGGGPVYQVNVKGFIWLQDFVTSEILLSVSSMRRLI